MVEIDAAARYRESRCVALAGMGVNVALSAAQMLIGWFGHSQALLADGVHTLSDLLSDGLVLFAAKHGARDADDDHPYGHARIETAGTLVLSALLVAVGLAIAINAGLRLIEGHVSAVPSAVTLVVALVTLISKEVLYRYTRRVADRVGSDLLRASAWHHRSDALSSIVVAAGIAASLAGFRYLDAIAAVGVGLMIGKMGLGLGWGAARELVDTGLDGQELASIRAAIVSVCGVKTLHLLRTRRTGGRVLIDVHIQVERTVSVSEGHHIGEAVRAKLMAEIDEVLDVMVHIDPEDDETGAFNAGLPLRDVVTARLRTYFAEIEAAEHIEEIALHYLDGRLHVELLLPLHLIAHPHHADILRARFGGALAQDSEIGSLELRFR